MRWRRITPSPTDPQVEPPLSKTPQNIARNSRSPAQSRLKAVARRRYSTPHALLGGNNAGRNPPRAEPKTGLPCRCAAVLAPSCRLLKSLTLRENFESLPQLPPFATHLRERGHDIRTSRRSSAIATQHHHDFERTSRWRQRPRQKPAERAEVSEPTSARNAETTHRRWPRARGAAMCQLDVSHIRCRGMGWQGFSNRAAGTVPET